MTSSFISVGPQSQGPKMDLPILCVKVANYSYSSKLQWIYITQIAVHNNVQLEIIEVSLVVVPQSKKNIGRCL